jgi:hypothetical protein
MATKSTRLAKLIQGFCEAPGAERNLYDGLKKLLTDAGNPVRCDAASVVIDSPIPGTRSAPDLTLYLLGQSGRPMVTASHVFASIEVKKGNFLARSEDAVLLDKWKYVTSTTRHFYLVDQKRVIRYQVNPGGEIVNRQAWTWTRLAQDDLFVKAFAPISSDFARVSTAIEAFKQGLTGFAYVDVDGTTRREFIDAVKVAASTIREAVEVVVRDVLIGQVRIAIGALDSLKERWGDWKLTWTDASLPQVSYAAASTLTGADLLTYENAVDRVVLTIEPHVSALKLETVVLPRTAFRMGFDESVSLLSPIKDGKGKLTSSGKAVDSLGYETVSMILSRMLMVRFAEDHGLLKRYICNGGIEQFSKFAEHFNIGAQGLLREVYRKARDLYSSVFSAEALDWAVQGDDPTLSDALLHAMWLLSRWNFKTVKGDILAGVYDKYLDVSKRRALGEVYTRPELCRYMLGRCDAKAADTVLDPACGSGTFLVEHLHPA